jgi:hypothetical protein
MEPRNLNHGLSLPNAGTYSVIETMLLNAFLFPNEFHVPERRSV